MSTTNGKITLADLKPGDVVRSKNCHTQLWRVEKVIGRPVAMVAARTIDTGVHVLGNVDGFEPEPVA